MDYKYKCICGCEMILSYDKTIPPDTRKCFSCGATVERIKSKSEKLPEEAANAAGATAEIQNTIC